MNSMLKVAVAFGTLAFSGSTLAESVIDNVNVTQIGTYANAPGHFVWFSDRSVECAATPAGVYHFDETTPGGKSLFAMLTTALVNNRKVLVRSNGCAITEIYLK